jgi:hypothetical protein
MLRREEATILSSGVHIFSRLPREVTPFIPGNVIKMLKPVIDRIILASIKNLGKYPCPCCKVQMEHVTRMGEPEDRLVRVETSRFDDRSRREAVESARDLIFKKNLAVTNNAVENLLSVGSYLPIDVGSLAYSKLGFNVFSMLVVDVMHEVDLGVWKSLFIQLLRLLEATKKGLLNTLDAR